MQGKANYGVVVVVARPPTALNKTNILAKIWSWNHSTVSFLASFIKKLTKKYTSRCYTVLFASPGTDTDGHKSLSTCKTGGTVPALRPTSRMVASYTKVNCIEIEPALVWANISLLLRYFLSEKGHNNRV